MTPRLKSAATPMLAVARLAAVFLVCSPQVLLAGGITLSTESSVAYSDPATGRASGTATVTLDDRPPSAITLRAPPLELRGRQAFVGFPQNGGSDFLTLDASPGCTSGKACAVGFEVTGARVPGTYSGTIAAYDVQGKVAGTP